MNTLELYELSGMIDQSALHPTMGIKDLEEHCLTAKKWHTASVCVKLCDVERAVTLMAGSGIPVGCVVGFPAGNSTIEVKAFEAGTAIAQGAKEIDMVINIGRALDGEWNYVRKEIAELTRVCHRVGAIIKVIFETAYVSREEDITTLCHMSWYRQCSDNFIALCRTFSPVLQQFSVDECFLEMTEHLRGHDHIAVANNLREDIKRRLGFIVNIGIGSNKLLAKMASDFEKPDRVHTLWKEEVPQKMWPLPVRDLLWVGKKTEERLTAYGVDTSPSGRFGCVQTHPRQDSPAASLRG